MCRTNVAGLWAIGDVTAPPWLAHKASHEGVIAAEAIAQALGNKDVHPHAMDVRNIPGCTYCHPQVASVGLTEAKAKEAGHEVKVGNFPFIGNGKAIALGEAEGFVKTVFDAKTGELLGAHMIGAEVTELIQGYTVGKTAELVERTSSTPSSRTRRLSEMMHESVLAAYRAGDPHLRGDCDAMKRLLLAAAAAVSLAAPAHAANGGRHRRPDARRAHRPLCRQSGDLHRRRRAHHSRSTTRRTVRLARRHASASTSPARRCSPA